MTSAKVSRRRRQPVGGVAAGMGDVTARESPMPSRDDELRIRVRRMGRIRLNPASGCWVDLFDAAQFGGHHCRLHGPAEFHGLRLRENGWGDYVESLAVGPTAYVQCYALNDFDDTIFWLLPSQSVEATSTGEWGDGIDTVRIFDRPPFAYGSGYAEYMLWAASHLARLKD